ncbi:MAG: hypothetical protein LQ348_007470 [Seirophora lacunosa]|nr:MAG: hypothetical protein LQ348_007470 [Seirophora lacunosa]
MAVYLLPRCPSLPVDCIVARQAHRSVRGVCLAVPRRTGLVVLGLDGRGGPGQEIPQGRFDGPVGTVACVDAHLDERRGGLAGSGGAMGGAKSDGGPVVGHDEDRLAFPDEVLLDSLAHLFGHGGWLRHALEGICDRQARGRLSIGEEIPVLVEKRAMEAVGCAGWQEEPNEWTARRRGCSAFDLEVLESDASSRAPTAQGDGRNSNLARIVVDVPGASDTGVCKGTTDDVAVRRRVDQAQESSTKVKV